MQIDIQSSDLAEVSPVGGITEAAWQRGGTWDCQETTSPSGQCYTWTCDLQITEPAPQPHVNAASWWECDPLCEYVCVCTLLYAFLLLDRKRPRTRIHRAPSFFLLLFSTSRNQCQHILSIFLNFGCTEYGPQGFFPYTRLSREFVLLSRTRFSKNKTWSRKIHLLLFFDIFVFTIIVISALGL